MSLTEVLGLDFVGVSRAAMGTAIAVPQLRIQLDAGMNVYNFHPDAVFVSHCHSDHCFQLTHLVSRTKPARFFMPAAMTDLTESYLFASQQLSAGAVFDKNDYEINHVNVGVEPGETLTDFAKNKQLGAHVIRCHHRDIPCVGYAFYVKHKALRPDLQGMDKKLVAQLAKNGEVVSTAVEVPLFIFLGDTTAAIFDPANPHSALPFIEGGWSVVFVECSFISDDEQENARRTGHMHWVDLKPVVQSHPDVTFVLIHFSRRYSKGQIDEFFLMQEICNIRLFLAPEDSDSLDSVHQVSDFMPHSETNAL